MIALADVRAAAARIADGIRRTPLVAAPGRAGISLKLETMQVTGSFKARGALNAIRSLPPGRRAPGVVTASGGNHGLAVAYAAQAAGIPATIVLPQGVSPAKHAALARYGARIVIHGTVWDDSNEAALALAADGLAYLHPFADPLVIAGQGTIALELLEDDPALDTILVAIGGGGLISGVALAAHALKPGLRIVGIEPEGAPTLAESLRLGQPATLAHIDTMAGTLAPKSTDPLPFGIVRDHVDRIVLVSDAEMRDAAIWLWREAGIAAELSGAAAMAALLTGRYAPRPGERVAAIICGKGTDGL